jgi:uncharacterized protein (TIGR00251 family)
MPPAPAWIVATRDGCQLTVKATPRASRTEVAGVEEGWLRLRLQAPPVDGRANAALTEFLAKQLGLPRRAVTVVSGETGRLKRLQITGLGVDATRAKLGV